MLAWLEHTKHGRCQYEIDSCKQALLIYGRECCLCFAYHSSLSLWYNSTADACVSYFKLLSTCTSKNPKESLTSKDSNFLIYYIVIENIFRCQSTLYKVQIRRTQINKFVTCVGNSATKN